MFVGLSNGETAIIELKMCGDGYSLNYARKGLIQLRHYMENRNTKVGYLMVFDSRTKDFGKGVPQEALSGETNIFWKVVDVRRTLE